jgi:hypothetical protein
LISDVPHRPEDRRGRRAGAASLVATAIACAALAGCGGGGGGGTSSATTTSAGGGTSGQGTSTTAGSPFGSGGGTAQGHTVSDVLDAVLTSGDPDKACGTDFVTERYLSAAYGGEQGCVQATKSQSAADSLDIQGLAGESAKPGSVSVTVVPHGGVYDGEKITVSLVREGPEWKIDALKSNAPVGP